MRALAVTIWLALVVFVFALVFTALSSPAFSCEFNTAAGVVTCSGKSVSRTARRSFNRNTVFLPHPSGCPRRAFCGCGASVRVFGKPVRSLYLARNWFKFPRSSCAPGNVAVRSGHVFVIEQCYGDGTALASDYNSGGHKSRRHRRSLRGYAIVSPTSGVMSAKRRR